MGVILDLSVFKDETADIRMADGTVLHLKKPTERMVIHMLQMKDLSEDKPPLEILAQLNRISWEIIEHPDGLQRLGHAAAGKPYLAPPGIPGAGGNEETELAVAAHAVAEYAGISLFEALDLPVDLYMLFYKNSVVDRLMQTEAGRQYLEDCERYKQTKPDREALNRLKQRLIGGG